MRQASTTNDVIVHFVRTIHHCQEDETRHDQPFSYLVGASKVPETMDTKPWDELGEDANKRTRTRAENLPRTMVLFAASRIG